MKSPKLLEISIDGFLMVLSVPLNKTSSIGISERNATANQNVQSQDFGADVVSSYVWRGTQFGEGPHIQPYISTGKGGFEIGLWGSFPTTAAGGGNEQ